MDKSAALWTTQNLEHTVSGVSPKQFFMFREGDTTYTLQRGSTLFQQYLSVTELKAGGFSQSAVGGGKGGEGGINGKTKFEEKILEGNKFNIPLKPNLNSNMVEFGKLPDKRKAHWLGRGLTVNVNEYGKRRVSWDSVKGGKQAGKWVISNIVHNINVGLGPSKQNA
nr:hypothetical protein CFP56_34099 [Quercus suber]